MSDESTLSAFENALTCHFCTLQKREFDWRFAFGDVATIDVSAPWRLIRSEAVAVTSDDNGQTFGWEMPIDTTHEAKSLLAGATVERAVVDTHTADLRIWFDNGVQLQAFQNSTGHEAWTADFRSSSKHQSVVALGGGGLAFF